MINLRDYQNDCIGESVRVIVVMPEGHSFHEGQFIFTTTEPIIEP